MPTGRRDLRNRAVITGAFLLLLRAGGVLPTPSVAVGQAGGSIQTEPNCIRCHRALEGGSEAETGVVHDFQLSAHAAAGLSCVDCHGGDPQAPVDIASFDYGTTKGPGSGFRGAPTRAGMPAFCGRCHSDPEYMRRYDPQLRVDQERLYWTSKHGQAVRAGSRAAASCSDCHAGHRILSARDPRSSTAHRNVPATCGSCHADPAVIGPAGLDPAIPADYNRGVHGSALLEKGDMGAPACNDCHGNHGAVPPGISSVSAVCSRCHVSNAEDFQASPHGPVFAQMGLPACESCHSNHAIEATSDLMLAPDGTCSTCHVEGDEGMGSAAAMLAELERLHRSITEADSLLTAGTRKGIMVEQGRFVLRRAENGLVRGRAAVHTFTLAGVETATGPGLEAAGEARAVGEAALVEFGRRRGGWLIFLLLAALTLAGLALLIRYLERPGGPFPLRGSA